MRRSGHVFINRVNPIILARDTLIRQLKNLTDHYIAISDLISVHYPEDGKKEAIIFIAQMYIGTCYETIKSEPFLGDSIIRKLKEDPLFNFFHQCRNAAFHGNKFDFRQPNKKGTFRKIPLNKWRNYEITKGDQGKNLFENKIKIEDALNLLEDIREII